MKFFKGMFLVLGTACCLRGSVSFANSEKIQYGAFKEIRVDGKEIQLEQVPFSINGNKMLPLRVICESLGCSVSWDAETSQIKVTRDNDDLVLTVNSDIILVNDEAKKIYFAPKIVNNMTYVIPAVIQVGLGDKVDINIEGNFEIENRSKINRGIGFEDVRKMIYKENRDGVLIGVAQVNIPVIDNPENKVGLRKMNDFYKNYIEEDFVKGLESELVEISAKEFVDTIYVDYKVVADTPNVLSIEYSTFHGDSYDNQLVAGVMYDKLSGEEITADQVFRDVEDMYNLLMNAYKNGDKRLMNDIAELKFLMEIEKDAPIKDDEEVIRKLAFFLSSENVNIHGSRVLIWVSEQDGEMVLNFRYYGLADYRYVRISLDNVLEYLNMPFVDNVYGILDPVLSLLLREGEDEDMDLMAYMNVGDELEEYKGEYKLDVGKTFANSKIKPYDESKIARIGINEDEVGVIFDVSDEERGGVGLEISKSSRFLRTANSLKREKIDGKEYLVVKNVKTEYWEKVD